MVIQVLRARSEKAQDMDLNVVGLSLYSAFRIEIQAIFYSRTSIVYIRKGARVKERIKDSMLLAFEDAERG